MKNNTLKLVINALTMLLTVSIIISVFFPGLFPITQEEAAAYVRSHTYDKLVFVLIQIFQVLVPPISHYFTSILGGYLYGAVEGGLLNYTGRLIGQFMAFGLAYKFGEWVEKRYNFRDSKLFQIIRGDGDRIYLRSIIILLMIALPFFPDDELSYVMGLAKFPLALFAIVTVIGHILGSFALSFIGSGEEFGGLLFNLLAGATLSAVVALVYAWFRLRRETKRNAGSVE